MGNARYYYDVAQICCSGHVITFDYNKHPEQRLDHCLQCGAPTIHECPHCKTAIIGRYRKVSAVPTSYNVLTGECRAKTTDRPVNHGNPPTPCYCHNCGKPYPWTQKAIDSTAKLIDNEMPELTAAEQSDFKSSLPDIMFETSESELSAKRIARYLGKVSSLVKEGVKNNLFGLTLECAKRLIWP